VLAVGSKPAARTIPPLGGISTSSGHGLTQKLRAISVRGQGSSRRLQMSLLNLVTLPKPVLSSFPDSSGL
jgi:hypothetical protein